MLDSVKPMGASEGELRVRTCSRARTTVHATTARCPLKHTCLTWSTQIGHAPSMVKRNMVESGAYSRAQTRAPPRPQPQPGAKGDEHWVRSHTVRCVRPTSRCAAGFPPRQSSAVTCTVLEAVVQVRTVRASNQPVCSRLSTTSELCQT